MNTLGIDYGEKRIGLAFADAVGVPTPLPAAVAPKKADRFAQIGQIIRERRIDRLVVGYPYNMDGSVGFKAREVDTFVAELEKRFSLPVHRVDERLSSHAVEQALRGSRRKPSRQSGAVDSAAATLILRDFLDTETGPALLPEVDEDFDSD
ncbi:MAG: Holliday junction resolvase RuvX [Opitutales bacterium]